MQIFYLFYQERLDYFSKKVKSEKNARFFDTPFFVSEAVTCFVCKADEKYLI
jgi:hypothetical protein